MKKGFAGIILIAAIALAAVFAPSGFSPGDGGVGVAAAATTNPTPASPGYTPVVFQFASYTSSRTAVAKWKAPVGFKIVHASATARASSGTSPTLKVRGKNGAFTSYSTTVTVGTVRDCSLVASTPSTSTLITDETVQTVDLVLGGTSPSFSDITLFLWLKRL